MTASRLALTLAAVFALAGCDRYAADGPTVLQPGPPAAAVGTMYVKGNTELRIDQPENFRAQQVDGVTNYAWSVSGTGDAAVTFDTDSRLVTVTGTRPGPAIVRAEARSAEGRTLSVGSREVVVR